MQHSNFSLHRLISFLHALRMLLLLGIDGFARANWVDEHHIDKQPMPIEFCVATCLQLSFGNRASLLFQSLFHGGTRISQGLSMIGLMPWSMRRKTATDLSLNRFTLAPPLLLLLLR